MEADQDKSTKDSLVRMKWASTAASPQAIRVSTADADGRGHGEGPEPPEPVLGEPFKLYRSSISMSSGSDSCVRWDIPTM